MPRKPNRKKDETPSWLKSTHQELLSKTDSGESPKGTTIKLEKTSEEYREEALAILGVKEQDVDLSPKIEHLFRGIGGKDKIFEYLSGSEAPEARKLLDLRKLLTGRQAQSVPFEAYCIAASIPVKKMFGIISSEAMEQEEMAKQLLFRVKHSEVVAATIESALDLEFGATDRRMLHQAAGFVPVPKNSITHIHGNQITDNRTQMANIAVLPPVEDMVKRLGDRFNDRVLNVVAEPAMLESGDDDGDEGDDE